MGVLVGTSLIVIIPEGVETLYSANEQVDHVHKRRDLSLSSMEVRWGAVPTSLLNLETRADTTDAFGGLPGPVIPEGTDINIGTDTQEPPKTPTAPGEVHALTDIDTPKKPDEASVKREPHAWIGVSLISGFILMYLIDTLPSVGPPPSPQRTNIYSLSDLSSNAPSSTSRPTSRAGFSTTLGLVIHAAADGIALGASSTIPSISFIIFFAIMIHKAPAAFGLTTVLLKQGISKRQARTHLAAFSLAAPIGALCTWTIARLLGASGEGAAHPESMKFWTGVVLIFSGGTFL
jgi:solute carrier family 39 (zinc transporter), member 9